MNNLIRPFILYSSFTFISIFIYRILFSYTLLTFTYEFKHKTSYVAYFPVVLFNPLKKHLLIRKVSDYLEDVNYKVDINNYKLVSIVSKADESNVHLEHHVLIYCSNPDTICYDSIVLVFNDDSNVKSYIY